MRREPGAVGVAARWWLAALAIGAGILLWHLTGPRSGDEVEADIAPSALLATTFTDLAGNRQSLGQFAGRVVVLNFWATWCAPCREEMPAFVRARKRWSPQGVEFVGLANEDPRRVARFGKDMGVDYPLWVGGDEVSELSRRLGNRIGGLPYTVILDPSGVPRKLKVGAYSEPELDGVLSAVLGQKH